MCALQMVNDHFPGQADQRRLHSELARLGSDALLSADGSIATARTASGQLDVTASTDDLAALSFA
jgi:hypothetical protein